MSLDFFAGCVGGIAGVVVGYPLDTVKVLMQTHNPSSSRYGGTVSCIRSIVTREGVKGLYKGVTSPIAGVAAINAICFGVYGTVQKKMRDKESLRTHAVAGGVAGLVQSFVASPVELIKSKMQIAENSKQTTWNCLRRTYVAEGLKGVYKGVSITALREVPAFSCYFVTYEFLTRTEDGGPTSTSSMLFAGGAAGVASWAIVYPVDTVKTKLQTSPAGTFSGSYDCFRQIWRSEGSKGLFRGLNPTMLRAFPVNAITFTVVTWTMRLLEGEKVTLDVVLSIGDAAL